MLANSRVNKKFQTMLPPQVRKKLKMNEGDVLIWEMDEDDSVRVRCVPSYTDYLIETGSKLWPSKEDADQAAKEADEGWEK